MKQFAILRAAAKALRQNKPRTGLTMLGIIIGVGAVICVVAIGEGAQARVEQDVLSQLLIEAVMLSLLGGAIGIALGAIGARTMATEPQWPTRVSLSAIAMAFGCSAVIGVFFGYYPARRAARLDPIEALRFE